MRNEKRSQHFIDKLIQGRLILALVVVEMCLFLVATGYGYWQLNATIEDQMFKIHGLSQSTQPVMYAVLVKIIPWIIFANTLLIIGIDRWWGRYIKQLVASVRGFSENLKNLNLVDSESPRKKLRINDSLSKWLKYERKRCSEIREIVDSLSTQSNDREKCVQGLEHLQRLLR